MVRTQFGKRDSLRLEQSPGAVAIFSSPRDSSTATVPGSRLITVPSGSTWKTGLHWHEEYDETVRVVQGKAAITVCTPANAPSQLFDANMEIQLALPVYTALRMAH